MRTNAKKSTGAHWKIRFAVQYTTFPLDMLRYDACYFVNENESHQAARSIEDVIDPQIAVVETMRDHKGWWPTEGRWNSLGCKIVELPKMEQF